MPIDNNILERDIRVLATGRKSWLFSDTADGARASAVFYSLMLTCRASGVDPLTWLRHVLAELPQREEADDIGDLLPFNFFKISADSLSRISLCKKSRFGDAAYVNVHGKSRLRITR